MKTLYPAISCPPRVLRAFFCSALIALGAAAFGQSAYFQLDTSFSAPALRTFVMQGDGRIVGATTTSGVRLNLDGSVDGNFSVPLGSGESVQGISLQFGGKLILRGNFSVPATSRFIRLNPDGTRDGSFRPQNPTGASLGFAVGSDGRFYLTSDENTSAVQRFAIDGQSDATFLPAITTYPGNILGALTDGSVLRASSAAPASTSRAARIVRLLPDGSSDAAFLPDRNVLPAGGVFAIVPLPDGRAFVIGGDGLPLAQTHSLRLLRVTPAGTIDFAHIIPWTGNPELVIAGVVLDLMREANATTPISFDAELFPSSQASTLLCLAVHPNGTIAVRTEFAGIGGSVRRYTRTSAGPLSFDPKPTIVVESRAPNPVALPAGTTTLSVNPGGLLPLIYEWRRDGIPVAGAAAPSLTLTNVQPAHAGAYTLVVTNPHGSATSQPIRLSLDATRVAPTFPSRMATQTVLAGSSVTFSSPAVSTPAATYQWRFNNVLIPGATRSSLTLNNVAPAQAGDYSVTAAIPGASSTTAAALHVENPATQFYTGSFSHDPSAGEFVIVTKADQTGAFFARFGSSRRILVGGALRRDATGRLTGSVAEATDQNATVSLHAIVIETAPDGRVTGSIAALPLTFSGASLGTNAGPPGGYYFARTIAAANLDAHLILAPDNRVFAFLQAPGFADGGTTTVTAEGDNAIADVPLANGTRLAIAIEPRGRLSGRMTGGPFDGRKLAALRDDLPALSRLTNIATRGHVGSGSDMLIAGFVIAGATEPSVLVRAIGPSLASFGLRDSIADPTLILDRGETRVGLSENWGAESTADTVASTATRVGAFAVPRTTHDAALTAFVASGAYSAQVQRARGPAGVGLVEIYDSSVATFTTSSSRLVNLSTRGRVAGGEGNLIAGIVLTGLAPRRLLIRGIGPALTAFGVTDALADPVLTLSDSNGVLLSNDDWSASPAARAELERAHTAAGAFPLASGSADAAVLVTLEPGNYTVQIAGKGSGSGVALVEVYDLP